MPTGDALLDTALERVRQHQGAEPSTVIGPLSKGTRRAVLERLTSAGTVRVSSRMVLGLFPVRSWPLVDPWHAARARLAVQAAVELGSSPDAETAMLISLLLAAGVLHKVQPTTDRKAQILRVQHLIQDNWVAAAIRKALQDKGAVVAGLVDLPGFIGS
jgi:Golgi phosphoprotein 3 GPP34